MASDFIDEQNGYLSLTQEEYDEAKKTNPTIRKYVRQQLASHSLEVTPEEF